MGRLRCSAPNSAVLWVPLQQPPHSSCVERHREQRCNGAAASAAMGQLRALQWGSCGRCLQGKRPAGRLRDGALLPHVADEPQWDTRGQERAAPLPAAEASRGQSGAEGWGWGARGSQGRSSNRRGAVALGMSPSMRQSSAGAVLSQCGSCA